jgi:prevent-host-death family protein
MQSRGDMPEREPETQTITASEARAHWSHIINQVARRQTRVIVEKSGVPVAAIVSAQDLERLNQLEEQHRRDFKALFESQAAFRDIPDEELEQEVNNAIAEVRAEQRRRQALEPR